MKHNKNPEMKEPNIGVLSMVMIIVWLVKDGRVLKFLPPSLGLIIQMIIQMMVIPISDKNLWELF